MTGAATERPFEPYVSDGLGRRGGELTIGGVGVRALADAYGTPAYIYDGDAMRRAYRRLQSALTGFAEVYYSIKANPNPAVARLFVEEGAGLEIASSGELARASAAGCPPQRMLFAGPGKAEAELAAAIAAGLGEIHLESHTEIERVAAIARRLGRRVAVAVRVNPIAAAQGGAMRMGGKPAAFGFDEETLADVVAHVTAHHELDLTGAHLFAGTQILDARVLLAQWRHGLDIGRRVAELAGRPLRTLDLGGGLGVPYHAADRPLDLAAVTSGLPELRDTITREPLLREARVLVEPGRWLTASAGIYLMSVNTVKVSRGSRFVITDGGMHHHLAASGNLGQIIKRDYPIIAATRLGETERTQAEIVGPLCTPLDTLGRQTPMPELAPGDLIVVLQSGAYGLTASPVGFLSHPTPVEVLVEKGAHRAIRGSGA